MDQPSVGKQHQKTTWTSVKRFALRRVEISKTTWRFRLLVCTLIAFVVVAPGKIWLTAMATSLVREDALGPADLILVEMAVLPAPDVIDYAASLYHRRYAPRIAVTRYKRSDRLNDAGVELPRSLDKLLQVYWADAGLDSSVVESVPIDVIDPVTLNSARQVAEYCRAQHVARVIVVTPRYHSRRSTLSYARYMAPLGIEVRSSPPQGGLRPDNWWRTKDGILLVTQEYVRLLYYRAFVLRWSRADPLASTVLAAVT